MWLVDLLASVLPYQRAQMDAENGLPSQGQILQHYLMCWLIERGVQDRERNHPQ